ncbi:hypothetical protein F5Y19DRAFT_478026 [Xylariaceae sp. FL1651]|nr:hypothetical protein F5Y19DRAFT_478026 [Xylariaceae sp. FL1651]
MAVDDLDTEIKVIEERLVSLTRRIEKFEIDSKARIAAKHDTMLSELRDSVNVINRTILFLDQGEDTYIDSVIGPLTEPQATKEIVKKHSASMHENFTRLRTTATSAVKQAEDVKCQFSEFDVQLDILRKDLDFSAAQADSLFTMANSTLITKEVEIQKTKHTLDEKKGGIEYLEGRLEADKDERHRLRKKRAMAWASSIIFPPMVIRAVSLELDASDLRDQIKYLKEQIRNEEFRMRHLEREKATLDDQKKSLAAVVANTKALIARCEPLMSSAAETQKLVDSRIVEYHDLVLRTDDFASWTGDLSRQTNTFRLLGSSSRMQLQKSTARIITRLLEMDQAEVKLITADLKRV